MDVHIPTTKEIHMIAYLTLHGWELDYDGRVWTKPGFVNKVQDFSGTSETEKFDLEDAYWAEQDAQENSKSI